jgi:PiT family inorganic phosphate transporter
MGVGASKRVSAVRWGVAQNMLLAWVLTIPISAVIAALTYWLLQWVTGG